MIQAAEALTIDETEIRHAELIKWTALYGRRSAMLLQLIHMGNPPKVLWEKQIHMILEALRNINELLEQEVDK